MWTVTDCSTQNKTVLHTLFEVCWTSQHLVPSTLLTRKTNNMYCNGLFNIKQTRFVHSFWNLLTARSTSSRWPSCKRMFICQGKQLCVKCLKGDTLFDPRIHLFAYYLHSVTQNNYWLFLYYRWIIRPDELSVCYSTSPGRTTTSTESASRRKSETQERR